MSKVIRLTESDLIRLVKKVIKEQGGFTTSGQLENMKSKYLGILKKYFSDESQVKNCNSDMAQKDVIRKMEQGGNQSIINGIKTIKDVRSLKNFSNCFASTRMSLQSDRGESITDKKTLWEKMQGFSASELLQVLNIVSKMQGYK